MPAASLITVTGVAVGMLLWRLVRRNSLLGTVPVWVRLHIGLVSALVLSGVVFAFSPGAAASESFAFLPVLLALGYFFAEALRLNTPANWARWGRLKKRMLGGGVYDVGQWDR